jgi:hypothetical protein
MSENAPQPPPNVGVDGSTDGRTQTGSNERGKNFSSTPDVVASAPSIPGVVATVSPPLSSVVASAPLSVVAPAPLPPSSEADASLSAHTVAHRRSQYQTRSRGTPARLGSSPALAQPVPGSRGVVRPGTSGQLSSPLPPTRGRGRVRQTGSLASSGGTTIQEARLPSQRVRPIDGNASRDHAQPLAVEQDARDGPERLSNLDSGQAGPATAPQAASSPPPSGAYPQEGFSTDRGLTTVSAASVGPSPEESSTHLDSTPTQVGHVLRDGLGSVRECSEELLQPERSSPSSGLSSGSSRTRRSRQRRRDDRSDDQRNHPSPQDHYGGIQEQAERLDLTSLQQSIDSFRVFVTQSQNEILHSLSSQFHSDIAHLRDDFANQLQLNHAEREQERLDLLTRIENLESRQPDHAFLQKASSTPPLEQRTSYQFTNPAFATGNPHIRVQSEAPLPELSSVHLKALPRSVRDNTAPLDFQRDGSLAVPSAGRPSYPKRDDYPSYDGKETSNHYLFVREITQLRDQSHIPDDEILRMLPHLLHGAARKWWSHTLSHANYTKWNQWAAALIAHFDKAAWRRHINEQLQLSRFTTADLDDPADWANNYIDLLESRNPGITFNDIKSSFPLAIPSEIAAALDTEVRNAERSGKPFSLPEYLATFEDQASYYKARLAARPFSGNFSSSSSRLPLQRRPSAPPAQPPRPTRPPQADAKRPTAPVASRPQPTASSQVHCLRCHGLGHIVRDCPSPAIQALDVTDCEPIPSEFPSDAPHELVLEENVDMKLWHEDTTDIPLNALSVFAPTAPFNWADDVEASFADSLPVSALAVADSSSVPLHAFLVQADTSLLAFSTFLAPYGLEPFSPRPAVVYDDSGRSWLTPATKKAFLTFWPSSAVARQVISTPWLTTLTQRRRPFHWQFIHALEYLHLQCELNRSDFDEVIGFPVPEDLPPAISSEIASPPSLQAIAPDCGSPTSPSPSSSAPTPHAPLPVVTAPLLKRYRQSQSAPLYADPPVVRIRLNGHPALLTLDSGAAISVINERYLHSLVPHAVIHPSPLAHLSAFGTRLTPVGQFDADVIFEHHTAPVRLPVSFVVLRTETCPTWLLLGTNYMRAYGIDIVNSDRLPAVRIGCFPQHFSMVSRAGITAPLQALDRDLAPVPDRGAASPEPAAFADILSSFDFNPDLLSAQRAALRDIVSRFPMAFAHGSHQLGKSPNFEMKIQLDLPNPAPSNLRKASYPASPRSREDINIAIDELINLDLIRPSKSSFAAPAIMVYKPRPRMVIDYRALNAVTVPISYPMPRIDESLSLLAGAKFISTLDANKGFHQIRIHPDSQAYTAFTSHRGLYEYVRMPFGLKNAPAVFQHAMDTALHDELRQGWVRVYIDDIVVFSPSFDEHLRHLHIIFARIEAAGFALSIKKCRFGYAQLHALGHKVSGLQLAIHDNHLRAVKDFPTPQNVQNLRQFLGLAGYECRKVKHYAHTARPLTMLLRAGVEWAWTEERHHAFVKLKEMILSNPSIGLPKPGMPYRLFLDASFEGLGGKLCQLQNGDEITICYISRQLRDAEQRYGATQLECLALVWALEKLYYYLDGSQFEVITDCSAVQSLLNMKTPNRHMLRWQLAIQEYRGQMTIVHRPGKENVKADALSRSPLPNVPSNPAAHLDDDPIPVVSAILALAPLPNLPSNPVAACHDPRFIKLVLSSLFR